MSHWGEPEWRLIALLAFIPLDLIVWSFVR